MKESKRKPTTDPDEEQSLRWNERSDVIEVGIILVESSGTGVQLFTVVVDEGDFNGDAGGEEPSHVNHQVGILAGDGAGMGAFDGVEEARSEAVLEVDGAMSEHANCMLQSA